MGLNPIESTVAVILMLFGFFTKLGSPKLRLNITNPTVKSNPKLYSCLTGYNPAVKFGIVELFSFIIPRSFYSEKLIIIEDSPSFIL